MGPITPVNANAAGLLLNAGSVLSGAPTTLSPADPSSGNNILAPQGLGSGTVGISNLVTAVSEFLQSLGGGLENDRLLETLIALLVLLALIENTLKSSPSENRGLPSLAGTLQANSGGSNLGASVISIQQTSLSISMTSTTIVAAYGDPLVQPQGGQIDSLG